VRRGRPISLNLRGILISIRMRDELLLSCNVVRSTPLDVGDAIFLPLMLFECEIPFEEMLDLLDGKCLRREAVEEGSQSSYITKSKLLVEVAIDDIDPPWVGRNDFLEQNSTIIDASLFEFESTNRSKKVNI